MRGKSKQSAQILRHCHTWCPEAGSWRWLDILWLSFEWVLLYGLFFILWLMQFCWAEKKERSAKQNGSLALWFFLPPFPCPETRISIRKTIWQKAVGAVTSLSASCLILIWFHWNSSCLVFGTEGKGTCLSSPVAYIHWNTCGGRSCLPNFSHTLTL